MKLIQRSTKTFLNKKENHSKAITFMKKNWNNSVLGTCVEIAKK